MVRVFVWSLKFLCAGVNPSMRHDARPWQKSDKIRAGRAGKQLNAKGLLLEERGDWAWRKELFDFPSLSSTLICWMCQAGEEGVPWSDFSLKAAWRRCRLSPSAFFARQRRMGVEPSPLFEAPGFSISMCVIDHLHALDLGVSPTALGNLFWDAIMTFSLFSAGNLKARSAQLFLMIKKYHKTAVGVSTEIQGWSLEMVKQKDKGPKLRSKGAETRGLVPFGLELACELRDAFPCLYTETLVSCFAALLQWYLVVSADVWNPAFAEESCRQFCIQFKALSDHAKRERGGDSIFWKIKLKMHQFCELALQGEQRGSPRSFWSYLDEDFVGFIAKFASSKGGARECAALALAAIQRFRAYVRSI